MDVKNSKLKGGSIIDEFFASKKNSNCLLDLERLLLSQDEDCILSSIETVSNLFTKVFQKNLLNITLDADKTSEDYRIWLYSRYDDFISHLLWYLTYTNSEVQCAALRALILFLELQNKYVPRNLQKDKQDFSRSIFIKIISSLASSDFNQSHLIKVFGEYTHYSDVKLYLLKALKALLENVQPPTKSTQISDVFLQNFFSLLCSVKFPTNFDGIASTETLIYHCESNKPFQLKEKPFRKLFSSVWNCILNFKLSQVFLKRVLFVLYEDILPNLQNPCLMTDFLTNAYNKGGVLSLLALKGLFFLMQNYNLEYPDFYVKLYALVDKDIIIGKLNSRFFILANLFLSSTHLPAHIVAAFVKKLSRLSLIASTSSNLKILSLVSNLLSNHISLAVLINRTDVKDYLEDPFNFDAIDPSKSNAMESSLWEIKTLQFHINPIISCKAKELTARFPKLATDVSQISNFSMNTLYTRQRKRKFVDVPLAIHRPRSPNSLSL